MSTTPFFPAAPDRTQYSPMSISESNPTCRRCGTCCRKGGPALHKVDHNLIRSDAISLADLFTIRPGELVFNQIKNRYEPTLRDIIKITGARPDTWRCRFYHCVQKSCRLYPDRPFECKLLKCWDTQQLESEYCTDRLGRTDLLGHIDGLMELIEFHQERCDHLQLNRWIKQLNHPDKEIRMDAQKAIIESVQWDLRIVQLAREKAGVPAEQLNFIFGRPIHQILKYFGWKIQKSENSDIHLCPLTLKNDLSAKKDPVALI